MPQNYIESMILPKKHLLHTKIKSLIIKGLQRRKNKFYYKLVLGLIIVEFYALKCSSDAIAYKVFKSDAFEFKSVHTTDGSGKRTLAGNAQDRANHFS